MYRQRQFADLSQIEEYATAASGELATALVLAARVDGVVTVEDATTFASQNSASEAKLLQEELYFRWISERITDIKKKIKGIEKRKVVAFDAASQSTNDIFERS